MLAKEQKYLLFAALKLKVKPDSNGQKLVAGAVEELAGRFGWSPDTVRRVWAKTKEIDVHNLGDAEKVIAVLTSKNNLTGRRNIPLDNDKLKQIPKSKRGSLLGIETNLMVHML